MRILSTTTRLEATPGQSVDLVLDVVNTESVIEGVTAVVIGVPQQIVRTRPASLPLFPDASGEITVTFAVPATFAAGRHALTVEVRGSAPGARPVHHDLELVVGARPRMVLRTTPSVVRARRRGVFAVESVNLGNVPLDVALRARDPDRSLSITISPSAVTVAPGETVTSTITATGPRQVFGSDHDRPFVVVSEAGELTESRPLMLRQRPLVSRGLMTVLVLLAVVALWALIFLVGIRGVLGGDPLTKVAPASFFAGAGDADGSGGPAGALSKDGTVGPGVGGTLTGTVTSASDGEGVGRITVEAMRTSRTGLVVEASAATQADGTFTVAGLFPDSYYLKFSAQGYDTVWYPAAPSEVGATMLRASAHETSDAVDQVVVGQPATLSGVVAIGDPSEPVVATVVARPLWPGAEPGLEYRTETAADGSYTLAELPAPGTYELGYTAEGYQPSTVTEHLSGGQSRFVSDMRLGSDMGQISGTVTDGTNALGGVEVSTTVDGQTVVVGTPTLGVVGTFVVPGLPTPGTYVLKFAKEGFGEQTVVVDLAAGESRADLAVVLADGVGVLTGRVVGAAGTGIGGATVSVGGGSTAVTTTTLTSGDVGGFTVSGLATPGSYTLTFTAPGYAEQSVPVELLEGVPHDPVTVTMSASLGSVSGRVTQDDVPVPGVEVVATNGSQSWTTITDSSSSGAGAFVLNGLAPGTYTLTVSADGAVRATGLVTVRAGAVATRDLDTTRGG